MGPFELLAGLYACLHTTCFVSYLIVSAFPGSCVCFHHSSPSPRLFQVAAGWGYSAILTDTGLVWTFGRGGSGALGHGDTQDTDTPRLVQALDGSNPFGATFLFCPVQTMCISVLYHQIHFFSESGII
jgi:regulator of chromosome condensation (RCC1) repeat-containing protein